MMQNNAVHMTPQNTDTGYSERKVVNQEHVKCRDERSPERDQSCRHENPRPRLHGNMFCPQPVKSWVWPFTCQLSTPTLPRIGRFAVENWDADPHALKVRVDDAVTVRAESRIVRMTRFREVDGSRIDNELPEDLPGANVVRRSQLHTEKVHSHRVRKLVVMSILRDPRRCVPASRSANAVSGWAAVENFPVRRVAVSGRMDPDEQVIMGVPVSAEIDRGRIAYVNAPSP